MNLYNLFIGFTVGLLISGCEINSITLDIRSGESSDSSKSPSDGVNSLKLGKVELNCQSSLPVGSYFDCKPIVYDDIGRLLNQSFKYELLSSTCNGVSLSSEGNLTGVLNLEDGESCQYQIQVMHELQAVQSKTTVVSSVAPLTLSFDQSKVVVQKGQGDVIVNFSISRALSHQSKYRYRIAGQGPIEVLAGYARTGEIIVPAGDTSVALKFSYPGLISESGSGRFVFQIEDGNPNYRPGFEIQVLGIAPLTGYTKVSAGYEHACAINGGRLFCWGSNSDQRLGIPSLTDSFVNRPTQVGTEMDWIDVSVGRWVTCGIRSPGHLYCWSGTAAKRATGLASAAAGSPTRIGSLNDWTKISVRGDMWSSDYTCGIAGGNLNCWGDNYFGRLGTGSSGSEDIPVEIDSSGDWTDVSLTPSHTCGIRAGVGAYCWGRYDQGQLGVSGISAHALSPTLVSGGITDWQSIYANNNVTCALRSGGSKYCWGYTGSTYSNGVTAGGATTPQEVPGRTWDSLASRGQSNRRGYSGISGGQLFSWGEYNHRGGLGIGKISRNDNEAAVVSPVGVEANWTQVSLGEDFACGLRNGGQMFCWGEDQFGQLGLGERSYSNMHSPVPASDLTGWDMVSGGAYHRCGIRNGGELYCWGANHFGQLGNEREDIQIQPVEQRVGVKNDWHFVSAGESATCGIRGENRNLFCWGRDEYGLSAANIGDPHQYSPLQKSFAGSESGWAMVATGSTHACGIREGGLYCWGGLYHGVLGVGSGVQSVEPLRVGSSDEWSYVTTNYIFSCGINGGQLYCWGSNVYSYTGLAAEFHTPQLVDGTVGWTDLAFTNSRSCGIRNGELWCWGSGYGGTTLGQIGSSNSWSELSEATSSFCGIQSGDIYCWGDDRSGEMGDGPETSFSNYYNPKRITTNGGWSQVAGTRDGYCALKDKVRYCWGNDIWGTAGRGLATVLPQPVANPE